MHVCVTGSNGYIGSHLIPMLLARGWQVTAIDNFMYGQFSLADCCADPNFTLIRGDCRDLILMNDLLKAADVFIPLAAIVGAPACDRDPGLAWETNYKAIADHMHKAVCRVIMPTTNSGYGIGGDSACTEDSPLNPISIYGRSKVAAEKTVLEYGGVTLRLATLAGISQRMRFDLLLNDFCARAVRDRSIVLFEPDFRRNYLHVRDAALAIIWAMDHYDEMKGRPYNVGLPDANLTKRQLCERIKKQVPDLVILEAPIGEDPDKRDYIVSSQRILKTGWQPQYSLDRTIAEIIKAMPMFTQHRWGNV